MRRFNSFPAPPAFGGTRCPQGQSGEKSYLLEAAAVIAPTVRGHPGACWRVVENPRIKRGF